MSICERLIAVVNFYHREARKCVRGRAYLAACVMQGAALEGGLHVICSLYPKKVKKTSVYQRKSRGALGGRELRLWSSNTPNSSTSLMNFHGSRPNGLHGGKGQPSRASLMSFGS